MKKNLKKNSSVNHCWNTRGVWSQASDKCEQLVEYIHCRNCPIFSNEGKRVLDRVAPTGYLKEWRKSLSAKKKIVKADIAAVLAFRVGNEWFAIPAQCLHEVTERRTIHRIPGNNNNDISGVVNIGGEVRVCYSLESILGVKCDPEYDSKDEEASVKRFIVALLGDHYYVFCVNQVSGLCWYGNDDLSSVPATLAYKSGSMLLGLISHNENKIAILDTLKLQSNLEGIQI